MTVMYGAAWVALTAWAAANVLRACRHLPAARLAWTCGALALAGHVLLAFHVVHGWDHDAAFRAVALQTYAKTGLDWGGGLYVNYAFLALWLVDAAWWWLARRAYESRPLWLDACVHFVFLFVFVNATIVFGTARAGLMGAPICAVGTVAWLLRTRPGGRAVQTTEPNSGEGKGPA
ncbi:MAG: hypothetical protein U0793_33545 [Gemmataceae bacterium]